MEVQESVVEDSAIGASVLKRGALKILDSDLWQCWGGALHAEEGPSSGAERDRGEDSGSSEALAAAALASAAPSGGPADEEGGQGRRRGTRLEVAGCRFDDLPWLDLDRPAALLAEGNVLVLAGASASRGATDVDCDWLGVQQEPAGDPTASVVEVELTDELEVPEMALAAEERRGWVPRCVRLALQRQLAAASQGGRNVVEDVLRRLESGDGTLEAMLALTGVDAASVQVLLERGPRSLLERVGLLDAETTARAEDRDSLQAVSGAVFRCADDTEGALQVPSRVLLFASETCIAGSEGAVALFRLPRQPT